MGGCGDLEVLIKDQDASNRQGACHMQHVHEFCLKGYRHLFLYIYIDRDKKVWFREIGVC